LRQAEAIAQIIEALAEEGFSFVRASELPTFEGSVTVLGRTLRLKITFHRLDFTRLPRVVLLDRAKELPGHRAHVEDDDAICYSSPGTLILDMYTPGQHALTVLALVRRTLGEILSGTAEADLATEFPQHWRGAFEVPVVLPPNAHPGKAWVVRIRRQHDLEAATAKRKPKTPFEELLEAAEHDTFVLARTAGEKDTFDLGMIGIMKGHAVPAFLARTPRPLRLRQGEVLPSNLAEFLAWAEEVDPALREVLLRAVVAADGATFLFLRAPNGCVGVLTIAPKAWKAPMAKMLRQHPEKVAVLRVSGVPADVDHAMTRNLAGTPTLAGRRIVLVGCGTIGGHLAKFLAQGGAGYGGGRFDLIDDQTYAASNIGRHWLPPRQVGAGKAVACTAELSAMFRLSAIHGHWANAMECLDLINQADLVVDATGEEPLSVALNDVVVKARDRGPALLLVWLRGMGAAAQALFVPRTADGRGCLRCLRPLAGAWAAAADVMRPDAPQAAEAPAACGEAAFVPYGVAAPAIAAGLAARMAMEWAAGDVCPSLRTVRVDLGATMAVEDFNLSADSACPACGTP